MKKQKIMQLVGLLPILVLLAGAALTGILTAKGALANHLSGSFILYFLSLSVLPILLSLIILSILIILSLKASNLNNPLYLVSSALNILIGISIPIFLSILGKIPTPDCSSVATDAGRALCHSTAIAYHNAAGPMSASFFGAILLLLAISIILLSMAYLKAPERTPKGKAMVSVFMIFSLLGLLGEFILNILFNSATF